jgi:hypothetical protein
MVAAGTTLSPAVASAAASATGVWGPPHALLEVGGLGAYLTPDTVTCSGPGDCVAGGFDNSDPYPEYQAAFAQETRGVWSKATLVPGLTALAQGEWDEINSISCSSPGDCAAVGWYSVGARDEVFEAPAIATERNGKWINAFDPPSLRALNKTGEESAVTSVSCTGPGDCSAGGFYSSAYDSPAQEGGAFVIDERNWKWGNAEPVAGFKITAMMGAGINAVSCSSPGNCTAAGAVGAYDAVATPVGEAFVLQETKGAWHTAKLIPAMSTVALLSCPAAGDCVAAGQGTSCSASAGCPAAFVTEKNGVWAKARTVLSPTAARTKGSSINALACGSAGDCVAGGSFGLLEEKNGTWRGPMAVPGTGGDVLTVSCPAAGDCDAGGYYTGKHGASIGFLVTETRGAWGKAISSTSPQVGAISCASPAYCAAVSGAPESGQFRGNAESFEYVIDKMPVQATRTTQRLSTAKVTYGHEQAERLSVVVSAGLGAPVGAVLVNSGGTFVCVIGLVGGAGSCLLSPHQLAAGTHSLVGSYTGGTQFRTSVSAAKNLTVAK